MAKNNFFKTGLNSTQNQSLSAITTFGVAACFGGSQQTGANAPYVIQASAFNQYLSHQHLQLSWKSIISPLACATNSLQCLRKMSHDIARQTYQYAQEKFNKDGVEQPFLLISADHSSAVGTWSGVVQALPEKTLGLIWIDAHLDAHTLLTSPSGNLHGMPLSILLNKADKNLQATYPLLNPATPTERRYLLGDNLSLLGIRSYEAEELALLSASNAHICNMQQLLQNPTPSGQLNTLAEDLLSRCDIIGISLDLDAISPDDAPAVETPVKNGIASERLISMLEGFAYKKQLVGFEMTEFNPANDIQQKTEKLIMRLIAAMFTQ